MAVNSFDATRKSLVSCIQQTLQHSSPSLHTFHTRLTSLQVAELDSDRKTVVDQAYRDVLSQYIQKNAPKGCYEGIISLAISSCNKDLCNATLPVILLADLFDCQTIDACEELFEFVESRVDTWKQELFFNNTKNNLLRMCNDLLRRLSRSQNTVFCGRILLFLAKFFPLSERSGLNIVSEFNLDNHTLFGTKDDIDLETFVDENDESTKEEASSSSENPISVDYNLYRKFWSLQDVFRNPNSCYTKYAWKTFTTYSADVLSAFGSFKLDDIKSGKKKLQEVSVDASKQVYFAKYLTNQKLLELQLSDHNFRRYVLLQFLIMFQYLRAQVKFKTESHVLTDDQSTWVQETTNQIYKLLEETPPDGARFATTIEHILVREEYWNKWKNEGCPEFHSSVKSDVDKGSIPHLERSRKRLSTEMTDAYSHSKILIGNAELTRLWNLCPDNMEACRSHKRDFLPSLEDFIEDTDNGSVAMTVGAGGDSKKPFDSNHAWRTLRLLSRRSPHFFTSSNQPIRELPMYLQSMIKRVAKEMPAAAVPDEVKTDLADKEDVGAADDESDEEEELLENAEEKNKDDSNSMKEDTDPPTCRTHPSFTPESIRSIARQVALTWKQLAVHLKCEDDEVAYYEDKSPDPVEQALHMLTVWTERGDEATPELLANALRAVGQTVLAESISPVEEQ